VKKTKAKTGSTDKIHLSL